MNSFFSILVPPGSRETDCITEKTILEKSRQISGLLGYDPLPLKSTLKTLSQYLKSFCFRQIKQILFS